MSPTRAFAADQLSRKLKSLRVRMHSVRLEPTKLTSVSTRTTYIQATVSGHHWCLLVLYWFARRLFLRIPEYTWYRVIIPKVSCLGCYMPGGRERRGISGVGRHSLGSMIPGGGRFLGGGCDNPSTPLGPQSRFGDKPLGIGLVCPQNRTAVLRGLISRRSGFSSWALCRVSPGKVEC